MATELYHGTQRREILGEIDLRQAARVGSSNANFGSGFYMTLEPNLAAGHAGQRENFKGGDNGGVVYTTTIPENLGQGFYRSNPPGWIISGVDVDQKLITDLATGMRKLGKDPVSGHDFATAADRLEADFKAGKMNSYNGIDLVKRMQYEYGVPDASKPGAKTSTDVFRAAGIKGMEHSSAVIILDPESVEKPRIHSFKSLKNPEASAVGGILEQMNKGERLPDAQDRAIRKQIVEAAFDVENKNPAALQKLDSVRAMLEASGRPVPPAVSEQLKNAQVAAAKAAGIDPSKIEQEHKIRSQVEARPARGNGEGVVDYQNRVGTWHEKTYPGASPDEKKTFNTRLNDTLYREAIAHHAQKYDDPLGIRKDPAKVEAMVRDAGHNGERQSAALNHFEDEMGRYHSTSEWARTQGARAAQAGKASLPGMVAMGATAAVVAGTMATKGASAAEIGRELKEQLTPASVRHAMNGEKGKLVAEVGGGIVATATGAATGAAIGSVAGPPGALIGGAVGGIVGGLGLHEPAKKGLETAINGAEQLYDWAAGKVKAVTAPDETQKKFQELMGSGVVGRVSNAPEAAPLAAATAQPEIKATPFKPS